MKVDLYLIAFIKINSQWIKDMNLRAKVEEKKSKIFIKQDFEKKF